MALLFETRPATLNGHAITRVLPRVHRRMVGPFIFIDIMGPLHFPAGKGLDVPPHPHIGLSTLTYLFEGALLHQDNLGNKVEIRPGDVNWMTAGKGIVHSERQSLEMKATAHQIHGMQCWVALPKQQGTINASFMQVKQSALPLKETDKHTIRLVAGSAYGLKSPVPSYNPMFYIDVNARKDSSLTHPQADQECMLYILTGELKVSGRHYLPGQTLILEPEDRILSIKPSRYFLLGGERWPETPFIDWNFVSFDKEILEQAKTEWQQGKFGKIPGDDKEYMPLP